MPVVRLLVLSLGATAIAVGIGVATTTGGGGAEPADVTEVRSVPLSSFDTTLLVVRRAAFCDEVPDEAVTEALDAEPIGAAEYGNGDRARLEGAVRDVAHEFSCTWRGADGALVRAWIFAPPVTPAGAAELVAAARRQSGCESDADAPAYGVPSLALRCERQRVREQSYRGLFGDAWLTCKVTAPRTVAAPVLEDRAGRWCVSIATAAAAD